MSIEESVFGRRKIDISRLEGCGFKREKESYTYSEKIMDGHFRADISISPEGLAKSKVYDLDLGEEYVNHLLENKNGGFGAQVRAELEAVLMKLRDNCTAAGPFASEQANRLALWLKESYGDEPEFLWEKFPGYGVFRNPCDGKWYAVIMSIKRSKLDCCGSPGAEGPDADEEIEIINFKLSAEKVRELLLKDGYFKAYHMNKKYWVSAVLDDTLRDEEIKEHIEAVRGKKI